MFLNFAKNCALLCLSNVDNVNNLTMPFLNNKRDHTVAIVTYCVAKMITACAPMVGQFFYTMIVALSDKDWLLRPIKI